MCGTPGQPGFPGVSPMVPYHGPAARGRNSDSNVALSGVVQPACHGNRVQAPPDEVPRGWSHGLSSVFALPLVCRIHEGVVFSNRDRRTLLDKMVLLID